MSDDTAEVERLRARVANLERFVGRLTHELGTPLATARGFASLLADRGNWDDATADLLARVNRAVGRAERTLRVLSSGALHPDLAPTGVHGTVREALQRLDAGVHVDDDLAGADDASTTAFVVASTLTEAVETLTRALVARCPVSQRQLRVEGVDGAADAVSVRVTVPAPAFTAEEREAIVDAADDTQPSELVELRRAADLVAASGGRIWFEDVPGEVGTSTALLAVPRAASDAE